MYLNTNTKYSICISNTYLYFKLQIHPKSVYTKLQADSNVLAFPEADRGNCLPDLLALRRFPASQ